MNEQHPVQPQINEQATTEAPQQAPETDNYAIREVGTAKVADIDPAIYISKDIETGRDWFYAEGLPGEGEKPEWFNNKTYKTIEEQAKAHLDLRKRLGGFSGAPEEYELDMESEKFQGLEFDDVNNFIKPFEEYAKEINMSNDAFNGFLQKFVETAETVDVESAGQDESYWKQEFSQLGQEPEKYVKNLQSRIEQNVPKDFVNEVKGMATSANMMKAIEWMLDNQRSNPLPANYLTDIHKLTASELRQLQNDPRMEYDQNFQREVQLKYEAVFGKK